MQLPEDYPAEQLTPRFPGTELPGTTGLYKRFATNPNTGEEVFMYCLFEINDDGAWWYEGSPISSSALNTPLRKSRFQHGDNFEWCGIVPAGSSRIDFDQAALDMAAALAEVKAEEQFAINFFGITP